MSVVYQCIFCGQGVAPGELDPCALVLVARIDRDRAEQKEQTFYCHLSCLRGRSALGAGTLYITDPDFPTVGEVHADEDRATETELWSSEVNAAVVRVPGRQFPGVVIQGDSLSILLERATDVVERLPATGDEELRGAAGELAAKLAAYVEVYEAVLGARGVGLPYARSRSDQGVRDDDR